MSVVSNSLTLFVLDIASPMGNPRIVEDHIITSSSQIQTRKRETTDIQWVCEFISARIAEVILRGLKTTKVAIITYGSPRTNNVVNDGGIRGEYEGIDEIFPPALPTLDTLDLVQSLRAVDQGQGVPPGDPLAALVDAIQLSNCPERGGIKDSQKNTWKRTIYLITDGRSRFSWDGADAIRDKIMAENLQLRLLGVDFDDPEIGYKEEHKDQLKRANEQFWHDFLADIPTARIASALDAVQQAALPTVQITRPSPSKMALTFGDPEDGSSGESISIPVALYKMTDVQRPMTQTKISKLAQESEAARREKEIETRKKQSLAPSSTPMLAKDEADDEPAPIPSYKAEIKREYFLLDDIGRIERGTDKANALPHDAEQRFTRAWKLGASLIPVEDEAFGQMDSKKGLEILHFAKAETYRREYNMEQIWYVFADSAQVKSQIQLSSFVRGLVELDLIAIVRMVRKDQGEPELGVLWPCIEETYDCFYFSRVPFREDLRRFLFPPLDRVVTKEGQELFEGPSIPTVEEQETIDEFVDAMDLMDVDDGSGETAPWFSILESFNPAIHHLKSAVRHRFVRPDSSDVPGPHPELVKYFQAPLDVKRRAEEVIQKCKDRFRIHYVPPKSNAERKKRLANEGRQDRENDRDRESKRVKVDQPVDNGRPQSFSQVKKDTGDGSETEEEDHGGGAPEDAAEDEDENGIKREALSQALPLTQPSERIGTETPADNFTRLLETQDDVTKLFVELLDTITYLLRAKEYGQVGACCKVAKRAAQEYEEAIRWNGYIRSLKAEVLLHHPSFWDDTMAGDLSVGLITEKEDEAEQSDVTEAAAREFVNTAND